MQPGRPRCSHQLSAFAWDHNQNTVYSPIDLVRSAPNSSLRLWRRCLPFRESLYHCYLRCSRYLRVSKYACSSTRCLIAMWVLCFSLRTTQVVMLYTIKPVRASRRPREAFVQKQERRTHKEEVCRWIFLFARVK